MALLCRRRRPYKVHGHSRRNSCFRNPLVVFCLSFLALGTLRFRVPVRTKKAAQHLLRRRNNNNHSNNNQPPHPLPPPPPSSIATTSRRMEYKLVQEGSLSSSSRGNDAPSFRRYVALDGTSRQPVTVQDWAQRMAQDSSSEGSASHAADLTRILHESPFRAFYFETKGVTARNAATKTFEFVLVDAPELYSFVTAKRSIYPTEFASHLTKCSPTAAGCVFDNLSGDAALIAPQLPSSQSSPPQASRSTKKQPPPPPIPQRTTTATNENQTSFPAYAHLAAFCRGAPAAQVHGLWKLAAQTYVQRLQQQHDRTVWFSTDGTGVAWLHLRLDSRPKYYSYREFARET